MCCMTYFDTITHPYQNLSTPSDFYAPQNYGLVKTFLFKIIRTVKTTVENTYSVQKNSVFYSGVIPILLFVH